MANRKWFQKLRLGPATEGWRPFIRWAVALLVVTAVLAAVAAIFDRDVAQYFKPLFGGPLHLTAAKMTDFGQADIYFGLAVLGLVGGMALRRPKLRNQSIYALAALTISGIGVQVLKHLIGRQRPYADLKLTATQFEFVNSNYEWHSLPSGHSQVAFTVATTMVLLGPERRVWQWSWFAIAGIIAMTRVITLNHWLSDTVIGAFVGVVGTVLAFRLVKLKR